LVTEDLDAIAGKAEQTGVFRGQCAELCGMDHGYMPIVVEVVEPETFQAWLDEQKGEDARVAMLDLFELLGPSNPLTAAYRKKLASALF